MATSRAAAALLACFFPLLIGAVQALALQSVGMKIMNHAGAPIDLYWVPPGRRSELMKQNAQPIRNGTDSTFNTYDTHVFMVKWANASKQQEGEQQQQQEGVEFTHGKYPSTVLVLADEENGLRVQFKDSFQVAFDSVSEGTAACLEKFPDVAAQKAEFLECVTQGMTQELHKLNSKITTLQSFNTKIANRLRNYTCADPEMESSKPLSTTTFNWNNMQIGVGTLYESERAKIISLENFVTDEECNTLMNHGGSRLQRATVSGDGGSIVVSNARQAQQATYMVDMNNVNDPLFDLKHRIFAFTNSVTGYNLTIPGQEEFTTIQYNPSDQYMPHCDGACDGGAVRTGGRVATVVMYCKAPKLGGGTSFSKADVFMQPKKGNAVFFSYMGPDGILDDGFTEHSGCPVLEGEKWITTQWMRVGVTQDNPWTLYDPLGGRVA